MIFLEKQFSPLSLYNKGNLFHINLLKFGSKGLLNSVPNEVTLKFLVQSYLVYIAYVNLLLFP